MTVREVVDPHDPAIAGFGYMQSAAYFAPETLIPASYIPQLLNGRRNFLVIAETGTGGLVVGGTLFHWLAEAGSGFSSFLGVDQKFRRQGIARRLHQTRLSILDRVSNHTVSGVFIDVVSPTRMPPDDLEREQEVGSDPWQRRHAFAALGFRQVDIRYEQPVGGPTGGPVTILDLLFCPRTPTFRCAPRGVPADSVPTALVISTMRAYWSPWLGASAASRHAQELESRAHGQTHLKLIPPDAG
jgi:hypothetical protein